jgi:hypothetical protein
MLGVGGMPIIEAGIIAIIVRLTCFSCALIVIMTVTTMNMGFLGNQECAEFISF